MQGKTENNTSENIIEVSNLSKSFGKIKAVDDLSFCVKRGSLFAFLGLNGAGKSTTINIICSILKKDLGHVVIDGADLEQNSKIIKNKIGIVFQDSVLDKQLTVIQNLRARVSLYMLPKNEVQRRIEYLCEMFDLHELLKRNFSTLSGGQRRRVDIARALIHNPKILILDEPTTGLDPTTRVKIWKIIEDLRSKEGLTVFLTTHYMEEAVRADTVIILDSGRIAAHGSPDFLKNEYTTDFVRIIAPRDEKTEELLKSENKKFEYKNNSYYVCATDSFDALGFINSHKELVNNFEILKGDMDDVFLNVTGKKLEVRNES